jgi:hypothetical protein
MCNTNQQQYIVSFLLKFWQSNIDLPILEVANSRQINLNCYLDNPVMTLVFSLQLWLLVEQTWHSNNER